MHNRQDTGLFTKERSDNGRFPVFFYLIEWKPNITGPVYTFWRAYAASFTYKR